MTAKPRNVFIWLWLYGLAFLIATAYVVKRLYGLFRHAGLVFGETIAPPAVHQAISLRRFLDEAEP